VIALRDLALVSGGQYEIFTTLPFIGTRDTDVGDPAILLEVLAVVILALSYLVPKQEILVFPGGCRKRRRG
jgi:hypothetical protein